MRWARCRCRPCLGILRQRRAGMLHLSRRFASIDYLCKRSARAQRKRELTRFMGSLAPASALSLHRVGSKDRTRLGMLSSLR